jgi:hypothetical protein
MKGSIFLTVGLEIQRFLCHRMADLESFTTPFRNELIRDLELSPRISCPRCVINYVGEYEDNCRYEEGEGLVCIYDYENTDIKTIIREWISGVFRVFRDKPVLQTQCLDRLEAAAP